MDSFEWNKIAGAVLSALLVIMAVRQGVNLVYTPHLPDGRAYAIEVPDARVAAVEEVVVSLAELLATGDAAKGQRLFSRCKSCHTVESGGGNRVGPNLYDVIGAALATREGFNYSGAMKGAGGVWDYDSMDAWLTKPKDFIPGNKMAYAGLRKPEDRANIILYLRQFAEAAPALPAFEAAQPEVEATPAEVEAAPTEVEVAPADVEAVADEIVDDGEPAAEAASEAATEPVSEAEGETSEEPGVSEDAD